jgi:hypothetical protein
MLGLSPTALAATARSWSNTNGGIGDSRGEWSSVSAAGRWRYENASKEQHEGIANEKKKMF